MHDALPSVTATPSPTGVDPNLVTPGPWGFVIIAVIAVIVIVLVWDMMRRIRRGRVHADIMEELDAEQQAADAVEATEVDDQSTDASGEDRRSPRG